MKMTKRNQEREVIIIGGGAAGMSAALWCAELKLKTILFESKKELGGQLARVYNPIKNHLGGEAENGRELRDALVKQVAQYDFQIQTDCEIARTELRNRQIFLRDGKSFSARAIIVATGVRRRKLKVRGEEDFQNRGIIESGKRDAETVGGKYVAIVGGGDAAAENALILSETAARVYLIHRGKSLRARTEFTKEILANKRIELLLETTVEKIEGNQFLNSLELHNRKTETIYKLPVDALLLRIGVEPNTELFREQLKLDQQGYVKVDACGETNLENVFAVGDVANPIAPTISTAVGTGATAAKRIFQKLTESGGD